MICIYCVIPSDSHGPNDEYLIAQGKTWATALRDLRVRAAAARRQGAWFFTRRDGARVPLIGI